MNNSKGQLNKLTHSEQIVSGWFGEYFEDKDLEDKYRIYVLTQSKIAVYVLSAIILFFYGFNLYYSYFDTNKYADLTYLTILIVIIVLHCTSNLIIILTKVELNWIKYSKYVIFCLFIIFGCYNLMQINSMEWI